MIKFLYDITIKQERPFCSPELIERLLDLNWNYGEKKLAEFCDQLLTSLTVEYRENHSSEIRNILNKKLRHSREILAAYALNNKLNKQLSAEMGQPCRVLVNCLDHGVDAVVLGNNDKILKYMELKSTGAILSTAKRKNMRGDDKGYRTATYNSTFKFHLNKTDDHSRNLLNLKKNLRKNNVCVFLYTMCFQEDINGIVDGFFLTGKNCASILDRLGGSDSLKQINPTSCYGKYNKKVSFFYTKDLNKDRI
jgi:hypothetical protein